MVGAAVDLGLIVVVGRRARGNVGSNDCAGDGLRGERLVQLHQVQVIGGQTRALQRLARGGNRPKAHHRRIHTRDRANHHSRQRPRAVRLRTVPFHLPSATLNGVTVPAGTKMVAFDVAAWSDLWFYSNPIYVEVAGSSLVAGVN